MIIIRTFKTFPSLRYWPEATWYDADLNELSQATAEQLFRSGGELYYTMPTYHGGELFRAVFAPQSGEEPAIALSAIDFKLAALMTRRYR